jgi:hypothetical protein
MCSLILGRETTIFSERIFWEGSETTVFPKRDNYFFQREYFGKGARLLFSPSETTIFSERIFLGRERDYCFPQARQLFFRENILGRERDYYWLLKPQSNRNQIMANI